MVQKIINSKAIDVDGRTKTVVVAVSEMESVDRDGDLIAPTAFNVTMKQRGPGGSNEIWHLLDHNKNMFSALSKPREIYVKDNKLVFVSEFRDTFAWREVAFPLYEAGDISQHSIGFRTTKEDRNAKFNLIKEVMLYEGSAVLWGANPNTPTMQVVKSLLNMEEEREITAEEKIEEIIRRIEKGK